MLLFLDVSLIFTYFQDYRHNAEAAKAALDGSQHKGRTLRVRFSNQGSAIKIKNLSPFVSNELLEMAMQQFGDVERAVVVVDDRGRSTGEGIVEFARKPGAQQALKRINDGVFLMTSYVEIKQRYMKRLIYIALETIGFLSSLCRKIKIFFFFL